MGQTISGDMLDGGRESLSRQDLGQVAAAVLGKQLGAAVEQSRALVRCLGKMGRTHTLSHILSPSRIEAWLQDPDLQLGFAPSRERKLS